MREALRKRYHDDEDDEENYVLFVGVGGTLYLVPRIQFVLTGNHLNNDLREQCHQWASLPERAHIDECAEVKQAGRRGDHGVQVAVRVLLRHRVCMVR